MNGNPPAGREQKGPTCKGKRIERLEAGLAEPDQDC